MRKYIILFLLWGVFGNAQYNLFARQNFAKSVSAAPTYNTYIGGVASTISTASLLATKLGISVGAISNFTVVGSDIKCKITGGSYAIPASAFKLNSNITYYYDYDNLVNAINIDAFDRAENLYDINLKGVTSISNANFRGTKIKTFDFPNATSISGADVFSSFTPNFGSTEIINIRNVTSLGSTSGNNNVFRGMEGRPIIYANIALQTNNAGSPDGDLTAAIALGATVRYVTNTSAPNPVTDLAAGTIYNTSIQLNFTAPTGSTNAIEFYECYADGILKNRIYASGEYIKVLAASTSYNITVYARDIYYNKSLVSNIISQSTNTTSYLESRTIAAYSLLTNAVDAKNSYNGTVGSAITFSSGAVFTNSTNSNIIVPDNSDFSFTNGTKDLPFSISFKINFSGTGNQMIVNKRANSAATDEWQIEYSGGIIYLLLLSNSGSAYFYTAYTFTPTTGVDYNFTFTYSGRGVSGIKIYRDGILRTTSTTTVGTYTKMPNGTAPVTMGARGWDLTSARLTAKLSNMTFFNDELVQSDVTFLQTNNYPF